jgi:hypothetical protein
MAKEQRPQPKIGPTSPDKGSKGRTIPAPIRPKPAPPKEKR